MALQGDSFSSHSVDSGTVQGAQGAQGLGIHSGSHGIFRWLNRGWNPWLNPIKSPFLVRSAFCWHQITTGTLDKSTWKCPKQNGATPSYHPFVDGIFREINHPALLEQLHLWKPIIETSWESIKIYHRKVATRPGAPIQKEPTTPAAPGRWNTSRAILREADLDGDAWAAMDQQNLDQNPGISCYIGHTPIQNSLFHGNKYPWNIRIKSSDLGGHFRINAWVWWRPRLPAR